MIVLEPKERLILEISIAAVFLAIVICGSIIVVQASSSGDTETTITNSFNTYNLYSGSDSGFKTYEDLDFYDRDDRYYDNDDIKEKRPLRYDSDADVISSEGIFGNDIKRYEVTVRNRDRVDGYFKVIFYFRGYDGEKESYAMTHYISARDEKVFSFKDISPSRYKYSRWWYEVESLTEVKN